MTRTFRLLAVSGAAALVLTGCGNGAVRTGAAATVGSDRITTSALDTVVTRGLADPTAQQNAGADRVAYERSVLGRLIERVVLNEAATQAGVSVNGATVDATLDSFAAQLGGLPQLQAEATKAGIAPQDLRQAIADVALRDALGDKLTASIQVPQATLQQAYNQAIAQFDQVHSAHILVATQALAEQILAKVKADPTQFAALAAKYSTDTSSKATGGDLGFQGKGALDPAFQKAIFTNKPGSFVIAHSKFGYHVIHVIARKTTTLAQATTTLRRNLLTTQRQAAVSAYLQKVARKLGVHVNPRFGSWDPVGQQVIATNCPATAVSSPSPRANQTPAAVASPSC
ncbi:MAG: PpiC-type peptidyl-prolyl cis-trans isomerase [Frankiales bacterium]|nr:PpiC-type peptidyl-prolyl cis-trans isomerase [Frankiales bacterium]